MENTVIKIINREKLKIISLLLLLNTLIYQYNAYASIIWTKNPNTDKKCVYLTFDDGPNGVATTETLAVLKKHNVKAAFFLIGKNVERYPEIAKQIAADGHIIGSHSYGHDDFLSLCLKKDVKANLEKNNKIIHDKTGVTPVYFRPPNGISSGNIKQACSELNMVVVGVNIFINDPLIFNADTIVKNCLKSVRKNHGGIIVLHDGFSTFSVSGRKVVAKALDKIIPQLKNEGYEILRIDER